MANLFLSKRYAKALFGLSLEMDVLETVKKDMEMIRSTCDGSKELRLFLKSPIIRSHKKGNVLKILFEDRVSELTMRFIVLLTNKKREKFLGGIAAAFLDLYKDFKNILTVELQTAHKIGDETKKRIIRLLEDHTKSTIEMADKIREELIGGFIMKYGDWQYDASIANQLNRLHRKAARFNLYQRKI
ncbi:MAG: ATP synthase F1 subunit delta [Bacteroidales bacterium]